MRNRRKLKNNQFHQGIAGAWAKNEIIEWQRFLIDLTASSKKPLKSNPLRVY